ncbi:MAG: aminopeptidase, partial [Proteobacteria bacterium]|nr:aminopeptidase [Pseudomonadota bacterium]
MRGGREVGGVYLEFKDGEIVKETAEKNAKFLHEMIETDKGSKF